MFFCKRLGVISRNQTPLGAILARIFRNFAQISRDFARIFDYFWKCPCTPCTSASYTSVTEKTKSRLVFLYTVFNKAEINQ